jgi:uncharacterized repeat protein (TIGR03803 family)
MKPTFCLWVVWGVMIFGFASLAQAAVTFSVVAQLGATAPGYQPNQVVEAGDGNYYGTTTYGGTNNNGTIFRLTTGGTLTTLYSFSGGTDGSEPSGTLTLGSDGKLYGTAFLKGASGSGTFFSITTSGTFTLLHGFNGTTEGGAPSYVVKGSDGKFYGTSLFGGTDSTFGGTFLQITMAGAVTVLHNFNADDGEFVNANIVQGSDGAFYGSTQSGGVNGDGTIFRITTGQAFSVLVDLDDNDIPLLTTLGADGLIYGTNGGGIITSTVFKMTNAGVRTTVHSFADATDGYNISSFILGSDGNYYGTTTSGGPNGFGTFFQIQPSGTFTDRYNFTTSPSGFANLAQGSDGNLYSASPSYYGSIVSSELGGAIIQMTTAGVPTTLVTFSAPGNNSLAALMQAADGNLYGTTEYGGATGDGTVYAVSPSGMFAYLADLSFNTTGSRPESAIVEDFNTGIFYTTATTGGSNYSPVTNRGGTLLSGTLGTATPGSGLKPAFAGTNYFPSDMVLHDLYDDDRDDDTSPLTLLTGLGRLFISEAPQFHFLLPHGSGSIVRAQTVSAVQPQTASTGPIIYSFTETGGDNDDGTFYGTDVGGNTTTLLYSFGDQTTDGIGPSTPPLTDSAGNIYGMTAYGGTAALGTVFKITPIVGNTDSTLTTIHNFTGMNSANPSASDGASGGNNYGFSNKLIFGSDGLIYGTTPLGGAYNQGTVFSMTTSGVVTVLHSFGANSTDGTTPQAGLVQGSDGNFYGTTSTGGANTYGTVFSITPQGVETIVHSFNFTDGSAPMGELIQANDGGYYGVTSEGGVGHGVVFRIGVNQGTQTQTISFPTIGNQPTGSTNVTLNATASSGLPVTYLLSGPATLANNVLTFTGAGTVTITAGQAGNTSYAPATESTQIFTVPAIPLISFATWETNNGIASTPPAATPENDGVPTLLKYLYDINPNGTMSVADRGALPTVGRDTTTTPGTTYLTLTYRQYASETGITINFQTSPDLQTWTTVTPDVDKAVGVSGSDTIMEVGVDISGVSKEFVRLNVTMP